MNWKVQILPKIRKIQNLKKHNVDINLKIGFYIPSCICSWEYFLSPITEGQEVEMFADMGSKICGMTYKLVRNTLFAIGCISNTCAVYFKDLNEKRQMYRLIILISSAFGSFIRAEN